MIEGVEIKELVLYPDERGYFQEVVRKSDPFFKDGFGQFSHTLVYTGVIKAWHYHKKQTQWTFVADGVAKIALYDTRRKSKTFGNIVEFIVGDGQRHLVVKTPPGVALGQKILAGPANVYYITSGVYDPDNDEGRIDFNDPQINFNWLSGLVVK